MDHADNKPLISAGTLLIWSGSILAHVLLVLLLCRTLVLPGVQLSGLRSWQKRAATFEAYNDPFTVEQVDGGKAFRVSTQLQADSSMPPPVPAPSPVASNPVTDQPPVPPTHSVPAVNASMPVIQPPASAPPRSDFFFGLRPEGKVVVFLIDVSGSMYEKTGTTTRLEWVFDELAKAVQGLAAEQKFNIVFFATRAVAMTAEPLNATEENKANARHFLGTEVDCGGTTNLVDGLALALKMKPDLLLLLTDGEADSGSRAILPRVQLLRKQLCPNARISTIGFYLDKGSSAEQLLQQLSKATLGDYRRLEK